MRGFHVTCYKGVPPPTFSKRLEIVIGSPLPVAFASLRALIQGLQEAAPSVVQGIADQYTSEWNELFPDTFLGVEPLETLALSPSERRLHRESEQVFRVLHVGARVIVSVLDAIQAPLLLRLTGMCDLVSLRAIMYAVEWSRIKPVQGQILLAEWPRQSRSRLAGDRMQLSAEHIRERMRAELCCEDDTCEKEDGVFLRAQPSISAIPDQNVPEIRYFQRFMDEQQSRAVRIAFAICAIRSCFFSTNYEGALLACEEGLAQLEAAGDTLNIDAVQQSFQEQQSYHSTAAIEINEADLASSIALQTFFLRSIAVIYALMGDSVASRETLVEALKIAPTSTGRARLHLLRALLFTKRSAHTQDALDEIHLGLEALQGLTDQQARLEEGWLRNLLALAYVQQRLFDKATAEEKRALQCLKGLTSPSATHLKINLISNLSVLQEMLKRYDAALQVWGNFARISDRWDANFVKHYRYREGTLYLKAGRRDEALSRYAEAYQYATQLHDSFHQQVIAADLGVLYLEASCNTQAATWFARANEAAQALGDPFRSGQSMLGYALATQQSNVEAALACVQESTTYQKEAQQLLQAAASKENHTLFAQLPHPRSKLNRPFDLINIDLFVNEAVTDKDGLVKQRSLVQA